MVAWRKRLIQEAAGFSDDTLAGDTDLTIALRRTGVRIRYAGSAIAQTEAPKDLRSLGEQRSRWVFDTLQAIWKHRDATLRRECGSMTSVTLPYIWTFQVLLAWMSPPADLTMVATLFIGNWQAVLIYYFTFVGGKGGRTPA